jgi:hypothetical protein
MFLLSAGTLGAVALVVFKVIGEEITSTKIYFSWFMLYLLMVGLASVLI